MKHWFEALIDHTLHMFVSGAGAIYLGVVDGKTIIISCFWVNKIIE